MLRIAQVLKSNGTEGELLISFFDVAPEDIDLQEPVYIEIDGLPVPFYFESFTQRGNSRALVRITGVRSLKDADELAGKAIYADYFEEEDENSITGWTVVDESRGIIGIVSDYEDIPGNTCIWVRRPDGQEVLLPLHEDLIQWMDQASRQISMSIPDGLLE